MIEKLLYNSTCIIRIQKTGKRIKEVFTEKMKFEKGLGRCTWFQQTEAPTWAEPERMQRICLKNHEPEIIAVTTEKCENII